MNKEILDLKGPLRQGNITKVRNIIKKDIEEKPVEHCGSRYIPMHSIGG